MLEFDLPKNQSSIIKVIGVGGGGSNAITHMYKQGITGVDFILCNTDAQALQSSPIPIKIQLGKNGLGAGSIPIVGKESALENIEEIKEIFEKNTNMLFVTAGMGGGTGTGAAPIIAEIAKEMGILTVGIVTLPFSFEGRKRKMQAEEGIKELKQHVDTLLIISNDKLRELHGDLKLSEAFQKADNILATAARGIAEIITVTGYINVDFEDVKTVMKNSGKAIMGSSEAEGENRARIAVEAALSSPLLNDNDISGAANILLFIASGNEEISMDEVIEITDYIQTEAGLNAEIIWGNGYQESLGDKIAITLIATGFDSKKNNADEQKAKTIVGTINNEIKPNFEPAIPEKEKETISEISLIRNKPHINTETKKEDKPKPETKINTTIFDTKPNVEENKTTIQSEVTEPVLIKKSNSTNNENNKVEEINIKPPQEDSNQLNIKQSDMEQRAKLRIQKLKDMSIKLKSPQEIDELEKEPAYARRNVELSDAKHSSETNIYQLSVSENKVNNLKVENKFLHDKAD